MTTYLYRPPTYKYHVVMERALRTYVDMSTTVYRIGGVWQNVLSPGMSTPDPSTCDVLNPNTSSALLLYFNTPTPVPAAIHDELAALAPADPSWSAGTLTLL